MAWGYGRWGHSNINATVVELADTTDSKSVAGNGVRVQVPLVAPFPDSLEKAAAGPFTRTKMSGIATRSRKAKYAGIAQ